MEAGGDGRKVHGARLTAQRLIAPVKFAALDIFDIFNRVKVDQVGAHEHTNLKARELISLPAYQLLTFLASQLLSFCFLFSVLYFFR